MRFQVPQFIEVEDKIFGPLTLKQFIYLAGGGAITFFFYRFFPFYIAIFGMIPAAGFALALTFYKVNNKPFVVIMEAALKYFFARKLYIWKKEKELIIRQESRQEPGNYTPLAIPRLSDSKLKDLTWSLDVKQSLNPVTKDE
jgi:hypothetical protein